MKVSGWCQAIMLACAALFIAEGGFAFSDQTTSERMLRDNKQFIDFINISMTNFGTAKRDDFRKAFDCHFDADVAFLQSNYRSTFRSIYASQMRLERLYFEMLKDHYVESSKKILDAFAPLVIKSKNARARLYLSLGYRDRTVAVSHLSVGDASNPRLYSYKLYQFEEGLKVSRRAKRYAFLALFESQPNVMKAAIYSQVNKNEALKGQANRETFFGRFVKIYDEIENMKKQSPSMTPEQASDELTKKINAEIELSFEQHDAAIKQNNPNLQLDEKVVRRVRFREEAKMARFLQNEEFDRAEDIMRDFIDDFNYKLIDATIQLLFPADTGGTSSGAPQNSELTPERLKLHLLDNYSRTMKDIDPKAKPNTLIEEFLEEKAKGK